MCYSYIIYILSVWPVAIFHSLSSGVSGIMARCVTVYTKTHSKVWFAAQTGLLILAQKQMNASSTGFQFLFHMAPRKTVENGPASVACSWVLTYEPGGPLKAQSSHTCNDNQFQKYHIAES